jgi:hypothetical protein
MAEKKTTAKKGLKKKGAKKKAPTKKEQILAKSKELLSDALQSIADQGHGIVLGTNAAVVRIVIDDFTYEYDHGKPEESRLFVNGNDITDQAEKVSISVPKDGIPSMTLGIRPRPRRYLFDAKTGKMKDSYVLEKGQ